MKMRVSSAKARLYLPLLILSAVSIFFVLHRDFSRQRIAQGTSAVSKSGRNKADIVAAYGKLPLAFEKNVGQSDARVRYLSRGNGYEVFLTPDEAVLSLRHSRRDSMPWPHDSKSSRKLVKQESSILRLQFQGANSSPAILGVDRLPGKIDYFTGNDPKKWHTGVPSYSQVQYRNLYPGVDAVFYGRQRRLEYDLNVAPGADTQSITLKIEGARKLQIDSRGDLAIRMLDGEVELERPAVYQKVDGARKEVAGNYVIRGKDEVGFSIPDYDRNQTLTIDPVLDYSTYLGGSATGDAGYGIAVDTAGDAYIAGITYSTTFPTTVGALETAGGVAVATNGSAFVTELNPAGTSQIYSSYLSGDNGDLGFGVAVDPIPNANCLNGATHSVCVYVTGQTFSQDFPNKNGYIAGPLAGDPVNGTIFLTKINPSASGSSSLVYSTFLGGTNGDFGNGVAVDATQNAYVTGFTLSTGATGSFVSGDFFVRGGFQTTLNSTNGNAFLIRIDTTQSGDPSLIYSTFLGGSTTAGPPGDVGNGVAVDATNNAYVVGTTTSSDFPVTSANAFKATAPTGIANGAAFVSKINTAATGSGSNVYTTFLSGAATSGDQGFAIALNPVPTTVAYVTGTTDSTFVVSTGAPSSASMPSAFGIVFVSKVDTSKTGAASVPYSATVGGNGGDTGKGIAVDTLGNIYVTGGAGSVNFPTTPGALQTTRQSTNGGAFLLKLNPGGNGSADILYSTYFSGTNGNTGATARSVALDATNNAYITGQTPAETSPATTDFPVTSGAFQTTVGAGLSAAFVSKLTLVPVLAFSSPCTLLQAPPASCLLAFGNQLINTASSTQTFTLTNNTGSAIAITLPITASGTNASDFAVAPAAAGGTGACTASLAASASCAIGVTFTPTTGAAESATVPVSYTFNNGVSATAADSQTVSVTGTGLAPGILLTPAATLNFGSQPIGSTSAAQPVTVKNTGTGNLILSAAPAIGGTNSGDFAIASGSTCTNGASISPNATCVINLTFTPGAAGARGPATLTIADNVSGSPQTITLTGTGSAAAPVATITPTTVPFGGQLVTSTSAAQAVSVKNTGSSTLNITAAPSISGTNASDFAIVTSGTTCTNGATVAPNATCTISITFAPPAGTSGSRAASLAIADNAAGSPQAVALTGTAWDFTLSAQAVTVNPGASGTIAVAVGSVGGFAGAVTLSCTGSIPQGSCSAPSSPVTAPGTGNVTIATHGFVIPPPSTKKPPVTMYQMVFGGFALLFLFTLPLAERFRTRLGLAGAAALLIVAAGCSNTPATPASTYPVTITGTSGSVTHTITVNVTVS